jgi:hypothetical protein
VILRRSNLWTVHSGNAPSSSSGKTDSLKGGFDMGKQIQWETSLTTAKAKAKKEKKLILMDFYNNL